MSPLHVDTLLALHAAGDHGVPLSLLLSDLRRGRHRALTAPQLEKAARDLADKSFVTPFETAMSGTRWRCTARGVSALEEEGLA